MVRELGEAFGRELVNARKFKGITLDQISESTKIQRRYLEAMEAGHWEILPQPYMEAFLKAYAEMVGMNVPKVMKMFRDMRRQVASAEAAIEEVPPEPVPTQPPTESNAKKGRKGWLAYTAIVIALLAVAGAVAFWLMARPSKSPDPAAKSAATPFLTDSVAQVTTSEPRLPETISTADTAQPSSDTAQAIHKEAESSSSGPYEMPIGVNLLARARQRCWLRATLDNRETMEALLAPGDTLSLKAKNEVELLIGNAGGLELEMDGESLGTLGPAGRAVTLVINPDGIRSQRLGKVGAMPNTVNIRK
jgi:cytoskeletal protein RodZ